MTDREVMQQALVAMGINQYTVAELAPHKAVMKFNDAITALRIALEQQAEPVAWMFQHDETGRMNYVSNDGIHNPTTFIEMNPRYALVCPLYTAPPQQQAEPVQENKTLIEWKERGEKIMAQAGVGFRLGAWWADRPWRQK